MGAIASSVLTGAMDARSGTLVNRFIILRSNDVSRENKTVPFSQTAFVA